MKAFIRICQKTQNDVVRLKAHLKRLKRHLKGGIMKRKRTKKGLKVDR